MNKIFFTILVVLISTNLMAQKKKKKKQDKTQPEIVEVVEEEVMEEEVELDLYVEETEVSSSYSAGAPVELLDNIRYNKKYDIYGSINDNYDWYYKKYSDRSYKKYGIVNKNGDVILPDMFDKEYGSRQNDVVLNLTGNYGLFDLNDLKWSIPMEYQSLRRLNNNLFTAKKNGFYGIIDSNNEVIVPFKWSDISSISGLENYVIVRDNSYPNNLRGIFSVTEKKLTVPCQYNSLSKLDRQNNFKVQNGSKYNIVDINNVPRFKKWYDEMVIPSKGRQFFIVKSDNRYGVIDDKEQQIVPMEYMEIGKYPYSDGSYLARNKEGKYGFMLLDGRVTLPFEYDNLTKKYNDNVVSVQNGKCGLVQVNSGVPYEILTCNYDDIKGVSKTFVVEKENKFGLLDEYGKLLTQIEYESLDVLNASSYYQNLIIKARKGSTYQLLDERGKPITTSKYKDISVIANKEKSSYRGVGFSYLKVQDKNKKYSVVDQVGTSITKPIFDDVLSETKNMLTVKSKGKYGLYYILDKKMVVDYSYDQIVDAKDHFVGLIGNKIDFLYVKSGTIVKKTSSK